MDTISFSTKLYNNNIDVLFIYDNFNSIYPSLILSDFAKSIKWNYIDVDYRNCNVTIDWELSFEYNSFQLKSLETKITSIKSDIIFILEELFNDESVNKEVVQLDISKYSIESDIELRPGNNGLRPDWITIDTLNKTILINFK